MAASDVLKKLRAAVARLRAEAAPLEAQLQRLDDVIQRADAAQAEHTRLSAEYEDETAQAIMHDREANPALLNKLNLAAIGLQKIHAEGRAVRSARPRVEAELVAINARMNQVAAEIEEQTWASLPAAAAHLFHAAEAARIEYERALGRLEGVADHAHKIDSVQRLLSNACV
jgi:small-conductance mechanosensitive channel